jgi:eukaryotic-like serine/threonine-protein kinase
VEPAGPRPGPPRPPQPRRRHPGRWVAAAAAVVLLALGGGYLLVTHNAPNRPGQASRQGAPSTTAATTGARSAVPSSAPARSSPPPSSSHPSSRPPSSRPPSSHPPARRTAAHPRNPMQAGTMTRFVADYYDLLPENQTEGWRRLGPDLQRIGFDSYTRFWSSVRSVSTSNLTADPARRTVSGTVTFVMNDGQTSREPHSFTLIRDASGTGLLINTDSAVNG